MRRLHTLMLSTVFGAGLVAAPMAAAIAQTCSCPCGQGQTTGAAEGGGAAAVAFTADQAPPPLPDYDQPAPPSEGYVWTPGYWSWNNSEYFWVPGTWVEPPQVGLLWTPGYWAFDNGVYAFHRGYWADHVGFYGGVDYGFGYTGEGYEGGRWQNGRFFYNRAVNNLGDLRVEVYDQQVRENRNGERERVSFNGGPDGTTVKPTREEMQAERAKHVAPTRVQLENARTASHDQDFFFSNNKGKPRVAATEKPGQFTGSAVVPAKGAEGATPGGANLEKPGQATPGAGKAGPGSANLAPGEKPGEATPGAGKEESGAANASPGQKPASRRRIERRVRRTSRRERSRASLKRTRRRRAAMSNGQRRRRPRGAEPQ